MSKNIPRNVKEYSSPNVWEYSSPNVWEFSMFKVYSRHLIKSMYANIQIDITRIIIDKIVGGTWKNFALLAATVIRNSISSTFDMRYVIPQIYSWLPHVVNGLGTSRYSPLLNLYCVHTNKPKWNNHNYQAKFKILLISSKSFILNFFLQESIKIELHENSFYFLFLCYVLELQRLPGKCITLVFSQA